VSWLALDTATERASVALGTSAADAVEENLVGARRHAAALLPLIERVLERGGSTLARVAGLVVSDGPGSFTGLRVGAAVAKALARARGLAVWTAPSLMARAAAYAAPGATVLAVANALRGELFAAAYRFAPGRVETLLAPSVCRADALVLASPRPDRIVGEAPPEALARLGEWARTDPIGPPAGLPRAAMLLELRGLEGGAREIEDVELWEPEYGRPAEAQARWERAHGRPLPNPGGPGR
jgi:tRNA threonylcarbamoyladenosine biosynthesis protein TsaB